MNHCRHIDQEPWWLNDARGIPVAKVCDECVADVRRGYRADIFTDSQYWTDEPVEPQE